MENRVGSAGRVQHWNQKAKASGGRGNLCSPILPPKSICFSSSVCRLALNASQSTGSNVVSQPRGLEFMVPWKMSHC